MRLLFRIGVSMGHLIQFIGQHWLLCGAFLVVLTAIVIVEGRDVGAVGGFRIAPQQVTYLINRKSALVVDLQEIEQFREGHIVGSKNIPFSNWPTAEDKLRKHKSGHIVLVDKLGQKSARCAAELTKAGFENVKCLAGGLDAWREAKLPLIKGSK